MVLWARRAAGPSEEPVGAVAEFSARMAKSAKLTSSVEISAWLSRPVSSMVHLLGAEHPRPAIVAAGVRNCSQSRST